MICQGRVMVGERICQLGDTADREKDIIFVDGVPVKAAEEKVYIMLNKPRGYVTTMEDERGRKTVRDLVECGVRVYPVGRLDMDSEGLLLMTNDGDLTNRLIHPIHQVEKTYDVWVKNYESGGEKSMARPMEIDGYRISPARVRVQWAKGKNALLTVTIHEGRNRQIRKMAEQCSMTVTRLRRVEEGPLTLGKLPVGSWRYLTENEIRQLRNL